MANITWIKMKVGMFDGISFKRIKRAKIAGKLGRDKLTAIWFELMDFAGKRNEGGKLSDVDDLSIMIDRDVKELKQCLDFFIAEEMINVSSDGIYNIVNWSVYQSVEEMDRIKEQTRKRVEKHRNKQKCNVTSNVTCNADVTQCNAIEEEREEEKEIDKEITTTSSDSDFNIFKYANSVFEKNYLVVGNYIRKNIWKILI